jgi:hypothetical protein
LEWRAGLGGVEMERGDTTGEGRGGVHCSWSEYRRRAGKVN